MSNEPPPSGSGQPPEDDPFRKQPPPSQGSPYDSPHGGQPPPYGTDPLAGRPPLADPGKRVLARLIDMVVVGAVVVLVAWAFGLFRYTADNIEYGRSLGQGAVVAVLYIAYDAYFTARNGQTPGKQLMKLRTANLDDGSTPSVRSSLTRAAVLWIPFAFCCACVWTAVSGGWSFFDRPYRQGLHDKAAGTVVVSTDVT
jgi:uncharacterized RDD family membrane protein YckC